MAWDWVGSVVTGVVGIAGIYGTGRAARDQRRAGLELAREDRQQRRYESAYLELYRTIDRITEWTENALPDWPAPEGYDPLPEPPRAVADEANALQFYWSPEVRALMREWAEARNRFVRVFMVARDDRRRTGQIPQRLYTNAAQHRAAMADAAARLTGQVVKELAALNPPVQLRWLASIEQWWCEPERPSLLRRWWRAAKARENEGQRRT